MKATIVLFAVLAAAVPITSDGSEALAGIRTTSGIVIGHKASWPENSDVDEYLGIPYAAPPLDNLRFRAPQPYKAKEDVNIEADDYVSISNKSDDTSITNAF
jgi:carboxylesterase type B